MIKRYGRYLVTTAFIIVAAAGAAHYWESVASEQDLVRWGSEGTWVTVPSGRLFMRREPKDPASIILLDAGGFATSLQMEPWAEAFAAYGSPITFDRSGLGLSYPSATSSTLQQVGDNTEALIAHIEGAKPLVYVGYSLSAAFAVDYARHHRERIRALILLDPTSDLPTYEPPAWWLHTLRVMVGQQTRQALQACLGWTRLKFLREHPSAGGDEARLVTETSCHHIQAGLREVGHMIPEVLNRTDFRTSLGDLPVIIVSSGSQVTENEKIAHDFHLLLAKISSRSHLIELPDVNHKTMINPENAARIAALAMAYVKMPGAASLNGAQEGDKMR